MCVQLKQGVSEMYTMSVLCIVLCALCLPVLVSGQACKAGFYGAGCTLKCGACKGVICAVDGSCTRGCEDGWVGDKCMQACDAGFYGAGCKLKCGACKDGNCAANGSCTSGCDDGWEGVKCMQEKIIETPPSTDAVESSIGSYLGIIAIVLALLVFGLIALATRGQKRKEGIKKVEEVPLAQQSELPAEISIPEERPVPEQTQETGQANIEDGKEIEQEGGGWGEWFGWGGGEGVETEEGAEDENRMKISLKEMKMLDKTF